MNSATVSSKGQITIPKQVREALDLRQGDQVIFLVEHRRAHMLPIPARRRTMKELHGIFAGARPFPGRDIERAAAHAAAAAHALGLKDPEL